MIILDESNCVCSECAAVVPRVTLRGTPIGTVVVPERHANEEGSECAGSASEAILPWEHRR